MEYVAAILVCHLGVTNCTPFNASHIIEIARVADQPTCMATANSALQGSVFDPTTEFERAVCIVNR